MAFAWEILRFGAAPVLPVAGLVAVLAAVYWALGAIATVGDARSPRRAGDRPAIAFYLQLATLDRRPPGLGWLVAFAVVAAWPSWRWPTRAIRPPGDCGLVRDADTAGVDDGRGGGGRWAPAVPWWRQHLGATVPESGTLQWRTQTGIGSGLYGGSSFNLFVGMQQSLLSLSDDPLFYATVSDSAPPNSDLYWSLITLDTYDGEHWIPGCPVLGEAGCDPMGAP
jgi:hypothetical protein